MNFEFGMADVKTEQIRKSNDGWRGAEFTALYLPDRRKATVPFASDNLKNAEIKGFCLSEGERLVLRTSSQLRTLASPKLVHRSILTLAAR